MYTSMCAYGVFSRRTVTCPAGRGGDRRTRRGGGIDFSHSHTHTHTGAGAARAPPRVARGNVHNRGARGDDRRSARA